MNNLRRSMMKFIDIGGNLTDKMFCGVYNGKEKHVPDLQNVLQRGYDIGVDKIIVTVGTIFDCDDTFKIIKNDERLYTTIGCHPTRCDEFDADPEGYFDSLCIQIDENREKVVAIGEMGLDYDRLHFCGKENQKKYFEKQIELVEKYKLPMFLHCRNAHEDFIDIITRNKDRLEYGGVVHSFDGTLEQAKVLIEIGYSIGLNGCSLKTEENLKVVAALPLDKIMLETDCPWCEVRPTHAGFKYVKTQFPSVKKKEKWEKNSMISGRCEPAQIIQVLEVIAGVRNEDVEALSKQFYENTIKLFFPSELNK